MEDVNISDLPRIVRKIKRTRHSAWGQHISCTALCHVAARNEQADVAIFHAGAIPLILDAMRRHVSEFNVQRAACKALAMLGKTSNEAVCVALREAVPLVLQAMRVHEEAAELQLLCCQAIWSIAQWPAHCVSFGEAGAIPLLARCVDRHTGDDKLQLRIQEWGCNALARLSDEDANVLALASPNTVAVVLKAMGRHTSVGEIQSAGCQLFLNVALRKEKEKEKADAADGTKYAHLTFEPGSLTVILEAMQLHPTERLVQMAGCIAMASDAFHENAPIDVATACALILRAMEAPANEHVRACGCCALNRFAEAPKNRAAMGQLDVIPVIVACMDRTTENKEQEVVSRVEGLRCAVQALPSGLQQGRVGAHGRRGRHPQGDGAGCIARGNPERGLPDSGKPAAQHRGLHHGLRRCAEGVAVLGHGRAVSEARSESPAPVRTRAVRAAGRAVRQLRARRRGPGVPAAAVRGLPARDVLWKGLSEGALEGVPQGAVRGGGDVLTCSAAAAASAVFASQMHHLMPRVNTVFLDGAMGWTGDMSFSGPPIPVDTPAPNIRNRPLEYKTCGAVAMWRSPHRRARPHAADIQGLSHRLSASPVALLPRTPHNRIHCPPRPCN